jgi:hypothetical protein
VRIWLLALVAGGCIEGRDPDACHADADCTDGTVCGALQQCDTPQDLHTATVRWTIDGNLPTAAFCARAIGFLVGFTDAHGDGFSVDSTCTDGMVSTARIPRSYASADVSVYGGADEVIGAASLPVPDLDDATVVIDVDLR